MQEQISDLTTFNDPGNVVIPVSSDPEGKPTTGVRANTGRLWSPLGLDMSAGPFFADPGNSIQVVVESENHVPIFGVDLENNRAWMLDINFDELQGQIDELQEVLSGIASLNLDPGNQIVAISEDSAGVPTSGVTNDKGRLWSLFGLDMRGQQYIQDPGNNLSTFVESENGVPILAVETGNNRVWALGYQLDSPIDPGNNLIVLVDDLNGSPIIGWDAGTNALWIAGASEDGAGNGGSTVKFVDPVTGVQPYMAIQSDAVIRYMDGAKWPGRLIGFEERMIGQLPLAIAQTPDPALGIVAFGGGTTYVQTPANGYPWHVLDTDLSAAGDNLEAQRAANEFLTGEDGENDTLYTIFALSEPVSSTVEADALSGSPARQSILGKVTAAQASAEAFGKRLYIDRIHLSLLEGQPNISQAAADLHYAGVSQDMALELATAAKQAALPITVVTQSFGTRDNGVSNVALAEGRLHWNHWSLGIVCATPRYPFPLVAGSPALHTETAALQIAELQNMAALAKLGGHGTGWFCPSLENATITGNVITAQFASMDDTIVIRDALNHGFTIDGDSAGAVITDVSVSGVYATITLDIAPVDGGSGLFLNYAYGQTGDPGDGFAANRGSITDSWSMESRHGGTLYRYALSNRVAILAA
ncbi:hypothetical protein [Paracoccus alkanivorans]|uniref:Uncharacterized protein n=1 Tax=Paracoccus alkanivorans TaxID=2116655 RepID=A0A3M0MBU5_9RHOB|nr:hypothetical protein [Paracoccus alkanivorans]RMC33754.1 hypothetical protein C9E81_15750 [Paracoccus alkanivorans]